MWELDCEESWVLKNWCFWTVVLEKTLESPLDCEEIQPVHPKEDQSWVFTGRTDAEAETPILGHLMRRVDSLEKTLTLGGIGSRRRRGWQRMRWHHWLDAHELGWTLGVGDGQGGLVCCDSWGCEKLDMTEWLNWTELNCYHELPGDSNSKKKNLPAIQETWVWSLDLEDPLEEEMATHSSILAWRILWTEEPGGLQSMESQRVRHNWVTNTHTMNSLVNIFCNLFTTVSLSTLKIIDKFFQNHLLINQRMGQTFLVAFSMFIPTTSHCMLFLVNRPLLCSRWH